MKIRSAKNKGRRLQNTVKKLILENWNQLEPDDVRSTSMGVNGEDIQLSPAARKLFPFSVECKNQENLNLYSAINQSEYNSRINIIPVLIIKKNHKDIFSIFKSGLLIPRINIGLVDYIPIQRTSFSPKINIWDEINSFNPKEEFIFNFTYNNQVYSCMKFIKLLELIKNNLVIHQ